MRITNAAGEPLELPDDLLWVDEFQWSATTATHTYTVTGALLIETAIRQAGRPISLVGPPDMAWVSRQTVLRLAAWAAQLNARYTLELRDGRRFSVAFRHTDGALEAEPVLGIPAWREGDWYRLTVRWVEV